ncbi:hypothetical protein STHU_21520 [Allostella humosa]|nr:hypothetical protein STHU_21520 [Stella humosa]
MIPEKTSRTTRIRKPSRQALAAAAAWQAPSRSTSNAPEPPPLRAADMPPTPTWPGDMLRRKPDARRV